MFRKVLVANRGEIAVRVLRTLRELGVASVAVYSDADRDALHVLMADEKVRIGPPSPAESYLNIDAILDAAKATGAEAIHPGYGFLSENPEFARRVEEEGLVFIGPPPRVLKLVGDKVAARRVAVDAGVRPPPGSPDPLGPEEAVEYGEELGYPVLIKPAYGGGGIGMRVARNRGELTRGVEEAAKLALSSFGRPEVYVEKFFEKARHIEVQVFGARGRVLHFYERECSVQRRFQKVVEEAPSPALGPEEEESIVEKALRVARALGYENAGTVEFVYDPVGREAYFLEVNGRIQVEHPVTEMVTGYDLVALQLEQSYSGDLGIGQENIVLTGHALEARVYAEDPSNNYRPSPGTIERLHLPSGPWVRVETGVYEGWEVPPFYDPLLLKVVAWGRDRRGALSRMSRALWETHVSGVATNVPLLRSVLGSREFTTGEYDTRILEKLAPEASPGLSLPPRRGAAGEAGGKTGFGDSWRIASRLGL